MASPQTASQSPEFGSNSDENSSSYISRPEDFSDRKHSPSPGIQRSKHEAEAFKTPRAASGNPRQTVADTADEYLHLGSKIGGALCLIWISIAFITIPMIIIGVGIIPGIILNILLISPKTVYKISEFILDFFGFGEIMAAADAAGLSNIEIKIKDWQKALIYFYDIILALVLAMIVMTILISVCTVSNSAVATVAGKASDVLNGTNTYSSLGALCSSLPK